MAGVFVLVRLGFAALVLSALAGVVSSDGRAANLVPNPGFEAGAGTPNNWQAQVNATIARAVAPEPVHSGAASLR